MLGFTVALGGCKCDDTVGGVDVGFRVDGHPIDFGRALEGTQVGRAVTLISTGQAPLTVTVATEGPFRAVSSLELPGGSEVAVDVTFLAGNGKATGKLNLSASGKTVSIDLLGEGVH